MVFILASGLVISHVDKRHDKLKATRSAESAAAAQLAKLEAKIEAKKLSLARLNHDPEYVEKVIRQKLNYAKDEEIVFKFEIDER